MTSFVDIVQKSGLAKVNEISKVKQQQSDGYSPATDYYKGVRESLVNTHKQGKQKSDLPNAQEITSCVAKWDNYQLMIDGYKKFWGKKNLIWFEPEVEHWQSGDVSIKVNPELGLYINGLQYFIKLYFKAEKLSKRKAELSLCLMNLTLPQESNGSSIIHAILDIRRNKLLPADAYNPSREIALKGEASYIQAIWGSL